MGIVLDTSFIAIANSDSIIGFEKVGGNAWRVWDRYLTIEGNRAYHIGNVCETCSFFFERLGGANQSISPSDLSNVFKEGLQKLDELLVTQVSKILPIGNYQISLLKVNPKRVKLGTQNDYFTSEQVELWGTKNSAEMMVSFGRKTLICVNPNQKKGFTYDIDRLFEWCVVQF